MRNYELLYVVSGQQTEAEAAKVTDAVNAGLQQAGAKVESENAWGRRRLAYQIDGQDHGWYVITRFAIDQAKLAEFQRNLRLNQAVLRTLLITADEVPTAEEAEETLQAVTETAAKEAKQADAKTAAKPRVVKRPAATEPAASEAKTKAPAKPTAAETKERKAKLEEKLGEILKDE